MISYMISLIMSRFTKLIQKILQNKKNIDFETLDKVLKHFEYECKQPGRGSSHYVYRKSNEDKITVPKNKPIKEVYVKEIIKRLKLEEWYEKNK